MIRFDESIVGALETQGKRLSIQMLEEFHRPAPRFVETRFEDAMAGGWPKYRAKRLTGDVKREQLADILLEYVNHNPRDGESWALQLVL